MIVAKVGGSLFDHPQFASGLRAWIAAQPGDAILVPGGGTFAEAVRDMDRLHALGDDESHWLALRAMDVAGGMLKAIVGSAARVPNCFEFFGSHDSVPHSWDATSDSLALAFAQYVRAEKLVLLKSRDGRIGEDGFVDGYFSILLEKQPIPVEVVDFRNWIESQPPASR